MNSLVLAGVGVVLLTFGLIYWYKIKPYLDAKKKKKEKLLRDKLAVENAKKARQFIVDYVLSCMPSEGSIKYMDLHDTLKARIEAAGGVFDPKLFSSAIAYGSSGNQGYLVRNEQDLTLGRKGRTTLSENRK